VVFPARLGAGLFYAVKPVRVRPALRRPVMMSEHFTWILVPVTAAIVLTPPH
jgi:hypothetical protein